MSAPDSQGYSSPLPPGSVATRRTKTGLYTKTRSALERRSNKLRPICRYLKKRMPWLEPSDEVTLRSLAEIEHISSLCFIELMRVGVLSKSDEAVRRLLSDYRLLKAVELNYLNALGATPESRIMQRAHATSAAVDLAAALAEHAKSNGNDKPDPDV